MSDERANRQTDIEGDGNVVGDRSQWFFFASLATLR